MTETPKPIEFEKGGRKSGATQEKNQRSYGKIIPEGYKYKMQDMEKQYDFFYQEYRKKLHTQYPSVAKSDLHSKALIFPPSKVTLPFKKRKKTPENSNQSDIPTLPVSPFLIPLTQSTVDEIISLVKIFYKMAHRKAYAKYIQTDKVSYLNIPVSNSSLLMSYDFHLNQDNCLKLIEVNTHSSGYLVSDLVDQVNGMNKQSTLSLASLRKSFEREWRNFSKQTDPPSNVLIADHQIKNQKMYIEFLMYRDLLNSWNWPCRLHEIEDINVNAQGILLDAQQNAVQMLYNRCTDFYFEKLPNLRKAFIHQKCCISPHPREYMLLADKMRLCEWSSEDFLNDLKLTGEEKKKIKKTVPPTYLMHSVSIDELWKKRKKLFFKPLRGYGGKSVYRGKNISHNMFNRIIKESGIIQEIIPPPVFIDPSGVEWKYDIRAYAYRDQVQKLSARVYQGQLTQFQTPLSGFASVCIQ